MKKIFNAPCRICITGSEGSARELGQRLRSLPEAVHELRLDCLRRLPASLEGLVPPSITTIVTLRPVREGGRFKGREQERIGILKRALECRPAFVDLEYSTPRDLRNEIYRLARGRTRIILSHHDFHGAGRDLERLAAVMGREPCHLVKIAVFVEDPADLEALATLSKKTRKPLILAAMGPGGLLTRILPERFGSVLSYAPVRRDRSTAPGQRIQPGSRPLARHVR